MYKILDEKQIYLTQQQTTTTELQVPDLGQAHTECGGVKLVLRRQP